MYTGSINPFLMARKHNDIINPEQTNMVADGTLEHKSEYSAMKHGIGAFSILGVSVKIYFLI